MQKGQLATNNANIKRV